MESGEPGAAGEVQIDIDPGAAALGTVRQLWIPDGDGPGLHVVNVRIPPAVPDGALLKVPGGPGGTDLFVRVRLVAAPPPGFTPGMWGAAQPMQPPPPRRGSSRRLVAVIVVVAAVIAVSGVAIALAGGDDDQPGQGTAAAQSQSTSESTTSAAPSSTPSPSPTPAGTSPRAYQAALTAFDSRVAQQFRLLRAARTPAAVSAAAARLQTALTSEESKLELLDPPERLQGPHRALLRAIDGLASDVEEADTAAQDRRFCGGAAADAWLSRTLSAQALRVAAGGINRTDPAHKYRVGGFVPVKHTDLNRKLPNGRELRRSTSGPGELRIDNGGNTDTIVNLVRVGNRTPSLSIYTRGGAKHNAGRIGDGTYQVFFSSGNDWDSAARAFTRDCGFQRFDETFPFTTTSSSSTIWSITLTATIGGNTTTSDVDPKDFPN